MGIGVLLVGVLLAATIAIASLKAPGQILKGASLIFAGIVLILSAALSSTAYVGPNEAGVITKNTFGPPLKDGRIVAIDGELGIQSSVLSPGWHFGYWPVVYSVKAVPLVEIRADELGVIESRDGLPLPPGQLFAPEWTQAEFQKMLDARYFLTTGNGFKGKQASVLTPGKYRINTEVFRITPIKQTEINAGEVAVLKANFGESASLIVQGAMGDAPAMQIAPVEPNEDGTPGTPLPAKPGTMREENRLRLAGPGEMGVRQDVVGPGKYPINTDAYTVAEIWTTQMIAHFTSEQSGNPVMTAGTVGGTINQEREITVRTSDGFTFPVDVRIEYHIRPEHAPIVVAKLGDDEGERFRNMLNSAVRATFRNNAEGVRALDYVQQRSIQERQSLEQLSAALAPYGVTVTAVRIGNVGDERSLGALLKTQTDREIAKQEQLTFQEQQRAAEQKKDLTRVTQEAEEEKRLATATYEVKIAEESQRKKIIEANAEAQSIQIKAQAQAEAYSLIAQQIGKSNAATLELLKIVGERNINITPRVLMLGSNAGNNSNVDSGGASGGSSAAGSNEATALIGTMLDHMISRDEAEEAKVSPPPIRRAPTTPTTTPSAPATSPVASPVAAPVAAPATTP